MELRQVRAFLAVAEHGGFRRAAARTYVSQPALSAQVHELERSLGVTLLVRRHGGAELTAEGAALVGPAQKLVDAMDSARRAAGNLHYTGTVSLGLMPGGAAELTRPLVNGLVERFPGVHLVVRPVELMDWHHDVCDEVDLLVASPPWPDRDLLVTQLLSDHVVLAYPWRLLPDRPASLTLGEALELPMARFSHRTAGPVAEFWRLEWLSNGPGSYHPAGPEVAGPEETRDVIVAGVAAAFGPAWATRMYPSAGYGIATLAEHPESGVRLLSRPDAPEVVQAMHVEAGHLTRELVPWVVGPAVEGPTDLPA